MEWQRADIHRQCSEYLAKLDPNDAPLSKKRLWTPRDNYGLERNLMRTKKEIDHALNQLRGTAREALAIKNEEVVENCAAMIKTLEWVKGDDKPGGFGDMIRDLTRVDMAGSN